MPPIALGIHKISVGSNTYFLITDLKGDNVIDVFERGQYSGLNRCMFRLAPKERTEDVITHIDPDCMITARGTFLLSMIRAAKNSLYPLYTNDLLAALDSYNGYGTATLKAWISTPIEVDLVADPNIVKALNRLEDYDSLMRTWVLNQERLRNDVLPNWAEKAFAAWKIDISRYQVFRNFVDLLDAVGDEIENSFQKPELQDLYNNLSFQAMEIIKRCQKCSVAVLRRRILLSTNPQVVPVKGPGDKIVYRYAGVSMQALFDNLIEYTD